MEHSELGISALAKHLGLAKSTVHRLASTLLDGGMLEQNEATGGYRLGRAIYELSSLARR
jgi:IclR family transcriptional regulator, KDG regulon repressor